MLYLYIIPISITGVITFSWYSFYGFDFSRSYQSSDNPLLRSSVPKLKHNIPVYMWDVYKDGTIRNGMARADIVRGVTPKLSGPCFSNRYYPNHEKQVLEFNIPEGEDEETLVEAEIRIMTTESNISFQVFHKDVDWVFLDAKSVPPGGVDWISLKVTPIVKAFKKSSGVSFLVLTVFRGLGNRHKAVRYLQPFLLLSYASRAHAANHSNRNTQETQDKSRIIRRKRNLSVMWEGDTVARKQHRMGNTCRRKPLYIEFAEIDFDTWIVAPAGYECVGKCTFPVGEDLSPTKHAIVQTLMHYASPSKVARACCVPTRLDPISILYVDIDGILTYRLHYHGMVVAECGCR